MTNTSDIIWLKQVDSTNDEARRQIDSLDNLSVISTYEQTAGRGQRTRTWFSEAGKNLLFSIVLKNEALNEISSGRQFAISALSAISLVELLSSYGVEAKIKWPNDIYVNDRKICGILIETSTQDDMITWCIIGIGLNVNQREFPDHLPNPTSMICELEYAEAVSLELDDILKRFIRIFSENIRRYMKIENLATLSRKYSSLLWPGSDLEQADISLASLL